MSSLVLNLVSFFLIIISTGNALTCLSNLYYEAAVTVLVFLLPVLFCHLHLPPDSIDARWCNLIFHDPT